MADIFAEHHAAERRKAEKAAREIAQGTTVAQRNKRMAEAADARNRSRPILPTDSANSMSRNASKLLNILSPLRWEREFDVLVSRASWNNVIEGEIPRLIAWEEAGPPSILSFLKFMPDSYDKPSARYNRWYS